MSFAIFSILGDGTLKNVGYQSILGKHARVFDIDDSGKFLIIANGGSGTVVVFKRDSTNGLLKKVGRKVKIRS